MNARRIRTPAKRLRVLVSSALGELAEEPTVVRDAVEQVRLSPVVGEAAGGGAGAGPDQRPEPARG